MVLFLFLVKYCWLSKDANLKENKQNYIHIQQLLKHLHTHTHKHTKSPGGETSLRAD